MTQSRERRKKLIKRIANGKATEKERLEYDSYQSKIQIKDIERKRKYHTWQKINHVPKVVEAYYPDKE